MEGVGGEEGAERCHSRANQEQSLMSFHTQQLKEGEACPHNLSHRPLLLVTASARRSLALGLLEKDLAPLASLGLTVQLATSTSPTASAGRGLRGLLLLLAAAALLLAAAAEAAAAAAAAAERGAEALAALEAAASSGKGTFELLLALPAAPPAVRLAPLSKPDMP